MKGYVLRRLAQAVFVLVPASVVVFAILQVAPGDPAAIILGPDAPPEAVDALRDQMGLNEPVMVQYWTWLLNVVQGDLGSSFITGRPVAEMIADRVPATLTLAAAGAVVVMLFAIPTGVMAARYSGKALDWIIGGTNSVLFAIPPFWFAILAILLFSLMLGVLPVGGWVSPAEDLGTAIQHLIMPALAVGIHAGAVLSRFVRSAVVEQQGEDYSRAARARGLSERGVLVRHALRNALVPITTVYGIQVAGLLGGVVVIETVFSWPGLGLLTIDAISARDYTVVQGALLILIVTAVVINLIVDLLYGALDPRVRVHERIGR